MGGMRIKNEYSAHTKQIAPRCDTLARKRKGFFSIFSVRYSASESLDAVDCVVTYSTRRVPMALATIEGLYPGLHPGFNLKHGIPANGASRNNQPRHSANPQRQLHAVCPPTVPSCPPCRRPTVGLLPWLSEKSDRTATADMTKKGGYLTRRAVLCKVQVRNWQVQVQLQTKQTFRQETSDNTIPVASSE